MAAALDLRFPKTALHALAMLGPKVIPYVLPWLDETVDKNGEHYGHSDFAQVVFGEIGAPAVPALIDALRVRSRQLGAADSLGAIGPAAAPAVPSLIRRYERSRRDGPQYEIVKALGNIGPQAQPAIPLLERVASGRDPRTETDVITRQAAQHALVLV
jgi:hypothetical protein